MPQSPREELLKLQKRIFRRNQGLIEESISIREKGFEKYQKTYEKYVRTFERESSIDELLEAILKADIIYVGDYHTNQQSQRTFLRLLKLILPKNSNILVAMELVHARYQKIIDAYLSQKISEEVFLKKMDLKMRWFFDLWIYFLHIFHYSSFHQIGIMAIEASASF
ncbi:MAG: ChaN family lipoprotein [Deltaproteobacteria bacterium]|nr:ChaN family lipoprotein [Deltaproteobacteria bacterium]